MRRLVILALLCLSCSYRPTWIERPPIAGGPGVRPSATGMVGGGGQAVRLCRVINRTRCAVESCKGSNMDLVTLNCGGQKLTRCEVGRGGC